MAPATWGTTVWLVGNPTPRSSSQLHHAPDRLEAEGAAAGQDDAVERGHEMARVEELEAVDAGGPAADLDAAHRGPSGRITVHAGEPDRVGGVADPQAGDHERARPRRRAAHVGQARAAQRDLGGHLEAARGEGAHERDGASPAARRRASAAAVRSAIAAGSSAPGLPEDLRHLAQPGRPAPARRVGKLRARSTPSTMAASRSALIWSETTRRLSRAWSRASASCCTSAGSTNQPSSSGRSSEGGGVGRAGCRLSWTAGAPAAVTAGACPRLARLRLEPSRRSAPAGELGRRHGAEPLVQREGLGDQRRRRGGRPLSTHGSFWCSRSPRSSASRRLRVMGPPAASMIPASSFRISEQSRRPAAEAALEEDPRGAGAAAVDAGEPGAHRMLGRARDHRAGGRGGRGARRAEARLLEPVEGAPDRASGGPCRGPRRPGARAAAAPRRRAASPARAGRRRARRGLTRASAGGSPPASAASRAARQAPPRRRGRGRGHSASSARKKGSAGQASAGTAFARK